jgi:succinyl-CoA synthetase alpha subunit
MLAELRSVLPAGTQFVEACETWEVVARAPESRMVVLAGDLGDTSSASLLRLLARRNPTRPVLAVGAGEHRQAFDVAHA